MTSNLSRVGKIGASELSFIQEYRDSLLEKGIISQEIYEKLANMGSFTQTRYSTAWRLQLDEKQLDKYQEFLLEQDRKKYNSAMIRGKACEDILMEQWLNENEEWKIVDSQVRVEMNLKNVGIPLIITCDFIVERIVDGLRKIIECKTRELNPSNNWSISGWEELKERGCPFSHILQVNQQMSFLGIYEAEVITGAIMVTKIGKGKNKTFEYEIADNFTQRFDIDPVLSNAVSCCVSWIDYEIKNNPEIFKKDEESKTKADLQIDGFLEDFTTTKEGVIQEELARKILRLQELKPLVKEFESLEKEVKSNIKEKMGLSRKIKLVSNSFELVAKYTKPSCFDEIGITQEIKEKEEALELAKILEVGVAKSRPSLRYEINMIGG